MTIHYTFTSLNATIFTSLITHGKFELLETFNISLKSIGLTKKNNVLIRVLIFMCFRQGQRIKALIKTITLNYDHFEYPSKICY